MPSDLSKPTSQYVAEEKVCESGPSCPCLSILKLECTSSCASVVTDDGCFSPLKHVGPCLCSIFTLASINGASGNTIYFRYIFICEENLVGMNIQKYS